NVFAIGMIVLSMKSPSPLRIGETSFAILLPSRPSAGTPLPSIQSTTLPKTVTRRSNAGRSSVPRCVCRFWNFAWSDAGARAGDAADRQRDAGAARLRRGGRDLEGDREGLRRGAHR